MKKTIIGAAFVVATVATVRTYGPALKRRAMAKCHAMMREMMAA